MLQFAEMAPPRKPREEQVELENRLVFSLLKAAVRVAARAGLSMRSVVDHADLAYFEEIRRGHPQDLAAVADRLGLSLRTAGSLNRRLKGAFFAPESEVAPLRQVCALLTPGPRTLAELARAAPELDAKQLRRALRAAGKRGWVRREGERYVLATRLRSHLDDMLGPRIDALNNQMEILAESVWARFIAGEAASAVGRSWTFAARPQEIEAFIDKTIRDLRLGAVTLEESALRTGTPHRYGATIAFARVDPKGKP